MDHLESATLGDLQRQLEKTSKKKPAQKIVLSDIKSASMTDESRRPIRLVLR